MLIETTLLSALLVLIIGLAALWSNPHRAVNRVSFSQALHVALWMLLLHKTLTSQEGLPWLRASSALGAFFPLHFWLVKLAVVSDRILPPRQRPFFVGGLVVSILVAGLCFTGWFVPSDSTPEHPRYGPAYFGYIIVTISAYSALTTVTVRRMRQLDGVRRLEVQLLLLGACAAASVILMLMGISAVTRKPEWVRLAPLIPLIPYATTAWAITTARVFDARYLLLYGLQRGLLVGCVASFGWAVFQLLSSLLLAPLAWVITAGLSLWIAAELNPWLQVVLDLTPKGSRDVRRAAYEISRREVRVERLEEAFLNMLRGWAKTNRAAVLFGEKGHLQGQGIELRGDSAVQRTLQALRWVTPERLARERSTPEREQLLTFLHEHGFGAMVTSGSAALSVVVGVGVPVSRRPFTYPEIAELVELTSIIENALARRHYSVKAQHAEQLATVGLLGASVAHEIRNPLVTIKTFVQLLPQRHADVQFREKFGRLVADEVNRIDRMTQQLLDLAVPRNYSASRMKLHPVVDEVLELVVAKAQEKGSRVLSDLQASPDEVYSDPDAAKQVLLNLCFNAIQATEQQPGDRWVRVTTANVANGVELTVTDNGPGIAAEMVPRLFQPFQSTKSSGFGLGLAICHDILNSLQASIAVDPPQPGHGATFRILFPCQPPSS